MVQLAKSEIVHLDPDGALPVVLALSELGVRGGQAAQAVWCPEMFGVANELEDREEVR